jgi:L-aspartate oxidase
VLDRRYLIAFDAAKLPRHDVDVLVIGSGIAGITAALHCARNGSVALVTKGRLAETNTWYAQGGIAGAVGEADSVELHLADTLVVGQGLNDEAVVRAVVGEAPEALSALRARGVHFDTGEGGEVALAREGGHSLPRVLHSGDATGAAIQDALTAAVRTAAGISIAEERFLVDLIVDADRCVGAVVLDESTGSLELFAAGAVVLATGGAGQAFRVTTNPLLATGDGVAAAWRAGAEVADMEFVQFHPTALDHDAHPRFLLTEALRGEGAYLLDCDEQRFMIGVHPLAELAPRDVVSREIERVMARCGRPNVWLDARHLGEEYLKARFPTIVSACAEAGYDLAHEFVPVAPAAHYMIGGVHVDIDGRTSIPGLFASGECAASGLHGANRLASNSLLEGLVFSRRIARALEAEGGATVPGAVTACATVDSPRVPLRSQPALSRVRELMSTHVGMSRSQAGLALAEETLGQLAGALGGPLSGTSEFELANVVTVAELIARGARIRTESRGCHSRVDFPERDDAAWSSHIVFARGAEPRLVPVQTGA